MARVTCIIALSVLLTHTDAVAQSADSERAILMELFNATGGPTWTRKISWGSERSVCQWQGVRCGDRLDEAGPVTRLELFDNNLLGTLPASITQLERLRYLDLSGNRLTGEFPKELLARADANGLQVSLRGNAFSNLLTHVRVNVDQFTGVCTPDYEMRFVAEIDGPANRALYTSVRCEGSPRAKRGSYCVRAEMPAPSLDQLSRALLHLSFDTADRRNDSPGGVSSHMLGVLTTITWGDGTKRVVGSSGEQPTLNVWIAQRLVRGLVPTTWESHARRVSCDSITLPE